jgi:hypothetical protein
LSLRSRRAAARARPQRHDAAEVGTYLACARVRALSEHHFERAVVTRSLRVSLRRIGEDEGEA